MRCMRSCITGLEQVWGKRKPGSAVNSQDSNGRAFQFCYSKSLPTLPCTLREMHKGEFHSRCWHFYTVDALTGTSSKPVLLRY